MITRKIQIYPVGDKEEVSRVYSYLRNGINVQNKAMNEYMTALYTAAILDASKDDRKELNQLFQRISTSKKGSAYDLSMEFPTGLGTLSQVGQAVQSDFKKSVKDGLLKGSVSLPTYKKNNPLMVHPNFCKLMSQSVNNNGLYHNYSSHEEFLNHLYKKDAEIYWKFVNNITFRLNLGNSLKKSYSLRVEMQKIFEEVFFIHGSKIQLTKRKVGKGDDIYLLLSIETPPVEHKLNEDTVVGVDLGVAIPAVCALNNKWQPRKYIGDGQTFIHQKQRRKNQRQNINRNLKMCVGGHGRKKKLKKLEKIKNTESNFTQNYSHKISKEIVDFAIKHNAKYINIEDLTGIDVENEKLLGLWKYYEVQKFITYKAAHHGIEVRKINPKYTSQICSCCGHWEEGQRDGRNFACKSCGIKLNADYNAARNIAMSENFVKSDSLEDEEI